MQEDMLLRHASQRRILAGSVGGATGTKKRPRLSPGPVCRSLSREPHPTFRELAPKHWNGK